MKASVGSVLMYVENAYPQDTRVRNEADALTAAGYSVTVIALRKVGQPRSEVIDGVRVYRVPRLEVFRKTPRTTPNLLERGWVKTQAVLGYITEYVYFTVICMVMTAYVAMKHGFDVVHAHNPPDSLFLVALPYKLLGKRYIYDHHDLCPELYRSRYGARHDLVARVLQGLEWCNLKVADVTVATNESYREIHATRGGRKPETVFVVRNGPNAGLMGEMARPSERLRRMNKKILCYIGSLNPQDGVDYLFRSLRCLRDDLRRDDFHCVVIGTGDSFDSLKTLRHQLKLEPQVELAGFVSDEQLREYLAAADICVDPDPSSPLNDVSTWIKIMEYMAYGKPIVSFDLKETRFSAQGAAVFVPCNDERAFAEGIATLMDDPDLRRTLGRAGRCRVEQELQWSVVSRNLLSAYASLRLPSRRHPSEEAARTAIQAPPSPIDSARP